MVYLLKYLILKDILHLLLAFHSCCLKLAIFVTCVIFTDLSKLHQWYLSKQINVIFFNLINYVVIKLAVVKKK